MGNRPYKYKTSFDRSKVYCLSCLKPATTQCNREFVFPHSHKLRPPLTIEDKVKFRKFLLSCPQFFNMVTEEQQTLAIELIRTVKSFNTTLNGRPWTNITK